MALHLNIVGWLLMLLSSIHIVFPRYFRWKQEFETVSLINRQVMYIHTLFVAVTVFLMGLLCCCRAHDLLSTPLGKSILAGLLLFWLLRLLVQFVGYSPALWRGKRKETIIHIIFSMLWVYFCVVFFLAYREM